MPDYTFHNPALARMRADQVALGLIVRLARSGDIARIAKSTGHDFIFIDRQHAIFTLETIAHIASTALGCGVTALVRVRGPSDPDISMLLDNGVTGIIVPDVNTADDARRAVDACKFAPVGRRSASAAYPMFDFRAVPDALAILNAHTLLGCMIETAEGLRNIDAIAAIDGVDLLHIGCNDFLVDIGKPGQFGCPEMMQAVATLIAACRKHGKFAGLGGDRDIARQTQFIRDGVRFVTTQTDIAYLMAEASRKTAVLREALKTT
jgi:2-keto-3-deoxy-L-rhamnonate aldolase RhmA